MHTVATDSPADAIALATERLVTASRTGVPCPPVRDLIGSTDVALAYAVQRRVGAQRVADGSRPVGRKIGLTSAAVQAQLGVDQPDFGALYDDMQLPSGGVLPLGSVMQPRAEAEIAFVLGADLADGDLGPAQVRAAVEYAVAAIEVCGSRIRDWDIAFGDTVADNASAGAFVLGTVRRALDDFEPREATMSLCVDGVEVSSGVGSACLGDPLTAVAWLAQEVRALGEPLRAGELVLSGALGPMREVHPGAGVEAHVSGLGSVAFTCARR